MLFPVPGGPLINENLFLKQFIIVFFWFLFNSIFSFIKSWISNSFSFGISEIFIYSFLFENSSLFEPMINDSISFNIYDFFESKLSKPSNILS